MAKYDPLQTYLCRQRAAEVELTFRAIESRLGYMLPNAAVRPDWWSCPREPGAREVQKQAWRAAGYDALLIEGEERVRFIRRAEDLQNEAEPAGQEPKSKAI